MRFCKFASRIKSKRPLLFFFLIEEGKTEIAQLEKEKEIIRKNNNVDFCHCLVDHLCFYFSLIPFTLLCNLKHEQNDFKSSEQG